MSKILILGGTGNISTGITNILLEKGGHEIYHLNRGIRQKETKGVKTLLADRTDPAAFKNTIESNGPFDCVIDMICFRPEEAQQAVALFKGNCSQYIFCSTVNVYDRRSVNYPIHEQQPIGWIHPNYAYAYGKVMCEQVFDEAGSDEFPVTVIRPAMTYAEGMPLIHLFGWDTYFIDRIRKGKPIIAHGDGTSIWVAAHRDDVAGAFVNAVGNPVAFGKKYNVTGMELMSWVQYYSLLAWTNGFQEPEFIYIPTHYLMQMEPEKAFLLSVNFAQNNIFDNTSAIQDLDYKYSIDWLEGSARAVTWLEENKKIRDFTEFPFYDALIDRWQKMTGYDEYIS